MKPIKIKLHSLDELNILLDLAEYTYESGNKIMDNIIDSIIETIYYRILKIANNIYVNGPKKSYTLSLNKFEALAFYELYYQYSKSMNIKAPKNVILMEKLSPIDKIKSSLT